MAATQHPTVPSGSHRRWWIAAACLATVALAICLTLDARLGDRLVYEKAAERLVRGETVYRLDDPPAFTYPPFLALPFVPLLALPPAARPFAWNLINCVLLATFLRQLVLVLTPWWRGLPAELRGSRWRLAALAAMVLLLGARFLISPLNYRSNDFWVLVGVIMSARALSRGASASAGIWAGLATACKATPLLFLPVFVWQRRWKAAAAMVAAIGLATLLPDVLFPDKCGRFRGEDWYSTFVSRVRVAEAPDLSGAWLSWNPLNQSLSGTMHRLSVPSPADQIDNDVSVWRLSPAGMRRAVLGIELLLLAGLAWGWRRGRLRGVRPQDAGFWTLGSYSLVLCCMLLMSPVSSKQHFCALFVGIVYLSLFLLYERSRVPSRWSDCWIVANVALLFVLGTLGAKDIVGHVVHTNLQARGNITLCAIACFLATLAAVGRFKPVSSDDSSRGNAFRPKARKPASQLNVQA